MVGYDVMMSLKYTDKGAPTHRHTNIHKPLEKYKKIRIGRRNRWKEIYMNMHLDLAAFYHGAM